MFPRPRRRSRNQARSAQGQTRRQAPGSDRVARSHIQPPIAIEVGDGQTLWLISNRRRRDGCEIARSVPEQNASRPRNGPQRTPYGGLRIGW